jgi:hypothetical protein
LKTLPLDRVCSKLSKKYLFARFGFLNLSEFEFEVAAIKQMQKRFQRKKKVNGLEPIWARETNLAGLLAHPGRRWEKN